MSGSTQDSWRYVVVRSDKPLRIGLLQSMFGVARTFVNENGEWYEVSDDALGLIQQKGREGWEISNKTEYTTPANRVITEWTMRLKLSKPQDSTSNANTQIASLLAGLVAQQFKGSERYPHVIVDEMSGKLEPEPGYSWLNSTE